MKLLIPTGGDSVRSLGASLFFGSWTLIQNLLSARGPLAIRWLIISVSIFSVNGVFCGRLFSHICEEVCERILPTFTNSNSSATIIAVVFMLWIGASITHVFPRGIFGSSGLSVSQSIFHPETSTTFRSHFNEACGRNICIISAGTFTFPNVPATFSSSYERLHGKASEYFSGKVSWRWHKNGIVTEMAGGFNA